MFIVSIGVGGFAPPNVNPLLGPCPKGLFVLGGFNPALAIRYYEIHRFFMPMLLHGGIIHFLFNALAELRFGMYVERRTGIWQTIVLYVLGTYGGCLLSGLFKSRDDLLLGGGVSVGASSAILALMGCHTVEILIKWNEINPLERKSTLAQMLFFIVLTLLFSALPFVDAGAHIGGLFVGVVLSGVFFAEFRHTRVVCGLFLLGCMIAATCGLVARIDAEYSVPTQAQIDYCG